MQKFRVLQYLPINSVKKQNRNRSVAWQTTTAAKATYIGQSCRQAGDSVAVWSVSCGVCRCRRLSQICRSLSQVRVRYGVRLTTRHNIIHIHSHNRRPGLLNQKYWQGLDCAVFYVPANTV